MATEPEDSPIHYLTISFHPETRFCLGCGNRFTAPAEHDFAVCHQALVEQEAARWPVPFPPEAKQAQR